MNDEQPPTTTEAENAPSNPAMDPDLVRLIEMVERMGGHGDQSL